MLVMPMSLWSNGNEWAVCDGPGPLNVAGYIVEHPSGGWAIKDDHQHRRFLDQKSAAASVLGKELPGDLRYYLLNRGNETGTVLTYPDVHERIVADGEWKTIATARTLAELDQS